MSYQKDAQILKELMDEHVKIRRSWFQHILLLASTLFGILISLHGNASPNLYARWCFALAIALLGLGILTMSIALYAHIDTLKRIRVLYAEEAQNASREGRATGYVSVNERKVFGICEKTGYICFGFCVILLSLYAVLVTTC